MKTKQELLSTPYDELNPFEQWCRQYWIDKHIYEAEKRQRNGERDRD